MTRLRQHSQAQGRFGCDSRTAIPPQRAMLCGGTPVSGIDAEGHMTEGGGKRGKRHAPTRMSFPLLCSAQRLGETHKTVGIEGMPACRRSRACGAGELRRRPRALTPPPSRRRLQPTALLASSSLGPQNCSTAPIMRRGCDLGGESTGRQGQSRQSMPSSTATAPDLQLWQLT